MAPGDADPASSDPDEPYPSTRSGRLLRFLGVLLLVPAAVVALNVWAPRAGPPTPSPTVPDHQLTSPNRPSATTTTKRPSPTTSLTPTTYLSLALDYIEAHGLYVDAKWPDAASAALQRAADATTTADTYPALAAAAQVGGGPDSLLIAPEFADGFLNGQDLVAPQSDTTDGITRINVPSLGSWDPAKKLDQAGRLFEAIATAQPMTSCGWIISLAAVNDADPWPTLAGLSPLLEDGPLLWLSDRSGMVHPVVLVGTRVLLGGQEVARVDGDPPLRIRQPIAVLLTPATKQAGVAVLAALATTPRHRTFGASASGTELAEPHLLPDGALLYMATTRMLTRDGTSLDTVLQPDVAAEPQAAEDAARAWLRTQCS